MYRITNRLMSSSTPAMRAAMDDFRRFRDTCAQLRLRAIRTQSVESAERAAATAAATATAAESWRRRADPDATGPVLLERAGDGTTAGTAVAAAGVGGKDCGRGSAGIGGRGDGCRAVGAGSRLARPQAEDASAYDAVFDYYIGYAWPAAGRTDTGRRGAGHCCGG